MSESEILFSIQSHYVPFLRKVIAQIEKKKDGKQTKNYSKLKYVFQIFTEGDKKEKIDVYHACKDMLDKWHQRYKDVKVMIEKKPDNSGSSSSPNANFEKSTTSKKSDAPTRDEIEADSSNSQSEIFTPITNIKKEKVDPPLKFTPNTQQKTQVQPSIAASAATPPPPRNEEVEFVCASCQFRTKDESDFMKHARTDHRTDLSLWCKHCGKCFSNAGVLVAHIKENNCVKEEMIYRCGVKECTFETSSGQTFVHHLRHCHKGSPFIFCIHCQKIFTLPHCLILHMQNECPFKDKNRRNPGSSPSVTPSQQPPLPPVATSVSRPVVQKTVQKPIVPKPQPTPQSKPTTNSYRPVQPSSAPSSLASAVKRGAASSRGRGANRGRKRGRNLYSESSDSEDPDDPSWKPEESTNSQPRRRSARWAKKVSESQNPDLCSSNGKKGAQAEQPSSTFIHCPCCDFSALYKSHIEDHYVTDHKHPSRNSCLVCNIKFESVQLFKEHFPNHEKDKEKGKSNEIANDVSSASEKTADSSDSRDEPVEVQKNSNEVQQNPKESKKNSKESKKKSKDSPQDAKMDISVETVSSSKSKGTLDVRNMDLSSSSVKIPYQTAIHDKLQNEKKVKSFEDLKSASDIQKMKTETKLKHFYKCVVYGCTFTTDDSVFYVSHLTERHKNKQLHCVYCQNSMAGAEQLAGHMLKEHGKRCYQCSLCFYRASSKPHVQIHLKNLHASEKGHVYTCSTHLPPNYSFSAEPETSNLTTTWPYLCAIGECRYQTYDPKDFKKHNEVSHRSVSVFFCYYCKVDFISFKRLMAHYHLHGINMFQCTYCVHGTETKDEILLHLANCHADKSLKVHVRAAQDPDAGSSKRNASESNATVEKPGKASSPGPRLVESACVRVLDEAPKLIEHFDKDIFCRMPFCETVFSDLKSYVDHMMDRHCSSNIPCPYCSVFLPDGKSFADHVLCHGPNLYSCISKVCGWFSWNKMDVNDHMINAHQLRDASPTCVRSSTDYFLRPEDLHLNEIKASNLPKKYTCLFCYLETGDSGVLKNHMYLELNYKRFLCNLCKVKCHSRKEAFGHFSEFHPHHNIKCTIDNDAELEYMVKSYLSPSIQKYIEEYVENEGKPINPIASRFSCFARSYSCESCSASFSSIRELQYHFKMCLYKEYTPYLCSHCDVKTLDLLSMKVHTNQLHPDASISYKTFKNKLLEEQIGRKLQMKRVSFFTNLMESLLPDKKQLNTIRSKALSVELKNYKCGYCKFNDNFRSNVEKHCQGCHKSEEVSVEKIVPSLCLPQSLDKTDSAASAKPDSSNGTSQASDKSMKRYLCSFCTKKTYTLEELELHVDSHHSERDEDTYPFFYWPNPEGDFEEDDPVLYECAYCSVSQENLYHLKRHCNNLHSDVLFKVRGMKSKDCSVLQCYYCSYKVMSSELLEKHCRFNHPKKPVKSISGNEPVKRKTDDHSQPVVSKSPKVENKVACSHCDAEFPSHAKLVAHVRKSHPGKSETGKSDSDNMLLWPCNMCSFMGGEDVLYKHMSIKHKDCVGCAYCKKYFETKSELEEHSKSAHPGQPLVIIKVDEAPQNSSSPAEVDDSVPSCSNGTSSNVSHYGKRPAPVDLEKITVKLETKNPEETSKLPVVYLAKMFDLFPTVVATDVKKKKKK